MFSKSLLRSATLALAALVLVGCATAIESLPIVGTEEPIRNSLSGRIGVDGPILVVKVDDTSAAHPQIGLEDADIVYIEQVEGGLTRIAAVYSSSIPESVGPVRSARISDIDLMAQFGRVAFAYSGAQSKMLPVIDQANLLNLGAQREGASIYRTDPMRNSPTAMILNASVLMEKVKASGESVAISKSPGWFFGDSSDTGTVISSVKLTWPAKSYEARWSKVDQRWLLSNSGVENIAASGIHLGPTTLVIQNVRVSNSIYGDKFGGVTPLIETVGSGTGYILRDGKSIPAYWSRLSLQENTKWRDNSGELINFAPGQIWVALTDREPEFTLPPTPAPSPSK